jgi:hypothetical protein
MLLLPLLLLLLLLPLLLLLLWDTAACFAHLGRLPVTYPRWPHALALHTHKHQTQPTSAAAPTKSSLLFVTTGASRLMRQIHHPPTSFTVD